MGIDHAVAGSGAYVSSMEIWVLGPTVLHREGMELSPGGLKQRTVLALLAAAAGKTVTIDGLIEGLYGDDPAAGARRTISTYISNLRREMGDAIVRVGESYHLDPSVRIDAEEFERLHRTGASLVSDDPARAAATLRDALAMWRGHAYVDVEVRSALTAEIQRLEEMRLACLDARIEADLALGLHRDLIGELEALTAEHPFRESFRAHHMKALYRSGRQSEALRAFGRTRTVLAEELGIDPSPELRDLELAILSQDPKLDVRIKAVIERRAVLAAELDDTVHFASHRDRDASLVTRDQDFAAAVHGHAGELLGVRGVAVYASFANVADAVAAASALATGSLRLAVDHGEVEVSDTGVAGPPIRRALRLAAIAHPGQVLVSADAQSALASGVSAGWTVRGLGLHDVRGLDGAAHVFQLVDSARPHDFPPLLTDRLPPPMPDRRSGLVPGYELRDEIGGGPAGALYRAYQATVGREVAVRAFRPELVSDPRFIRRFEAEAQRIAAINHPHLVPLLDFWRDPESAFMVYRLITGTTLRDEMETGPFDQAQTIELVERVAGAIRAAHGVELQHGRLRPESILLDADANPFVADVGLVGMLHGLVSFAADAYTAPEAITGDPAPTSDIYSLGVLLTELTTGTPFPADGPVPEVGGALASVIDRATAHDPEARHDTVEDFLDDVRSALGASRQAVGDVRNPYKGLSAFQEADAGDFYGRGELIDHLTRAVLERRLTVVVGPSGIGKSSVVRAGLIPRLRSMASDLLITDMIPGSRPFDQLEGALARVAVEPPSDQVEMIRSGRESLSTVLDRVLPQSGELLLVVDQFEELFTQVDDDTRRRFLDMIVAETRAGSSRVRIVLTLRADFFDRPLRHPEFGELIESAVVTVAAPSRDELAEIVVGPVGGVGVVVEEGLVAGLVADASGEAGGLPLLQHALTELFDQRDGNRLTLESYRAAGGLSGSIGRRADAVYAGLSDEDQTTAREVFLRLVMVEEQAEDTRRRVRRSELMGMRMSAVSVERVLDAFGRHRLLVFDRDAATRGPTVEVAHEALIQHWARLRAWVDEVRDDLLTRRRVEIATGDWMASGEDPGLLLTGGRLEQAEGWRSRAGAIDEDQDRFVSESRIAVDTAVARRRRIRRRVVAALSAALALAIGLGSFGWVQRGIAERETITARMQELATQAEVAIDEDPDLAISLALDAYELSKTLQEDRAPGEVMTALQLASQASRVVARLPDGGLAGAVSPDGGRLVVVAADDSATVVVYETTALERVDTIDAGGPVSAVAFSPDGRYLAVGYFESDPLPDSAVVVMDARSMEEVARFNSGCFPFVVEFDPTGAMVIASGVLLPVTAIGTDECVHVWTVEGPGDPLLATEGQIVGVTNDGELVVRRLEQGRNIAEYTDLASHERTSTLDLSDGRLTVSWSDLDPASGQVIISYQNEDLTEVWDRHGSAPALSVEHPGHVGATISPAGLLALHGNDDAIKVVDLRGGRNELTLAGNRAGVATVAFWPDSQRLAAFDWSGGTIVWDLTPAGPSVLRNVPTSGRVPFITVGPASQLRASVETRGTSRTEVYSTADSSLIARGPAFGADFYSPSIHSAMADVVGGIGEPGSISTMGGEVIVSLSSSCESPLALDPSGGFALISVRNIPACAPSARLVDLTTRETVRSWDEFGGMAAAAFGQPGTVSEDLIALNFGLATMRIESLDGSLVTEWDLPRESPFWPSFSSDGRTMSFGSQNGGAYFVDVEKVIGGLSLEDATIGNPVIEGGPTVSAVAEGTLGVSVHTGDELRAWDLPTGQQWFVLPMGYEGLGSAAITPDGRYLYYTGEGGVIRRMPLDPEELAELAESRQQRDFNVEECERFDIADDCSVYETS